MFRPDSLAQHILEHGVLGVGTTDKRRLMYLADNDGPMDGWNSGLYQEITPSGAAFPTAAIWYTDNTKTKKIVEETISYNGDMTINTNVFILYAADGVTPTLTMTDSYDYSGGNFLTPRRTRVFT